jgi:hypothetical protein
VKCKVAENPEIFLLKPQNREVELANLGEGNRSCGRIGAHWNGDLSVIYRG